MQRNLLYHQRLKVGVFVGKERKCRMKTLLRQFLTPLSRRRAEIEFTRVRLLLPRKQITRRLTQLFMCY